MFKSRIEAFTDAVIAIILTLLVLELPELHGASFSELFDIREIFIAYVISFFMLIIYWVNHHHLFQLIDRINGRVLWANNLLIFLFSLFPFATRWLGDHFWQVAPEVTYASLILLTNLVWLLLERTLIKANADSDHVLEILSDTKKNSRTLILNVIGVLLAFVIPIAALIINLVILLLWLIPDKRIEDKLQQ